MATIWIWNSIASRRRSSSDTFVENGLGVLAGAVEQAGHRVRIIDWARNEFYRGLTPRWMARISRQLVTALMDRAEKSREEARALEPGCPHPGSRPEGRPAPEERRGSRGMGFKTLGTANLMLQQAMAWVQRRHMAATLDRLADDVAKSGIRVFGMKVWYGEAFHWAKHLAFAIRERAPEVVLVAGGYHATLYEEDFLKNSPFDIAVISEGEAALTKILDIVETVPTSGTLHSGEDVGKWRAPLVGASASPKASSGTVGRSREAILAGIREEIAAGRLTNVVYRDGETIRKTNKVTGDINAKSVSRYGDMTGKVRLHVLLESAGCPWGKCHFCVHHHLEPEYLRRKVEKIVEEIRFMREQGIGLFRFAGSDTPPEFGAAIARGILSAGLKLEFAMGSRARKDAKDAAIFAELVENYSLMIKAGLRAVFIGGETGNDVINEKVMNKGLGFDDLVWTIRALRAAEKRAGHHVDISLAMIYPTPLVDGISAEQVKADNLRLVAEARPDSVMVSPPGPFKHSEWNKQRKTFGFEFEDSLIPQAMEYEYVLYKPLELWPKLGYKMGGKDFVELLRECGNMRSAVEELGVPTDLSDEHFLTMRACGYEGAEGARAFKRETLADIVSCDYRRLESLCAMANEYSTRLAGREETWPVELAPLPLEGDRAVALSDTLLVRRPCCIR